MAEEYGVQGFPTLKFFKNGEPKEYGGGRTSETIVNWVEKKSGTPTVALSTLEELEKIQTEESVNVIGLFSDIESEEAKAFVKAADGNIALYYIVFSYGWR